MPESRALAAFLLLSVVGAFRASAQNAADYRRRLDSLSRRAVTMDSIRNVRRTTILAVTPLDTVRAGSLTVVALHAARGEAAAVAESAWAVIAPTYGHSADALAGQIFVLSSPDQNYSTPSRPGELPVVATEAYSLPLVAAAAGLMTGMADSALKTWERGTFVPALRNQVRWDFLYIELVTSPWHRVQECYRERLPSCRLALGLDGQDSAAARWYDAEDRRQYVRTLGFNTERTQMALQNRCVLQRVNDACEARFDDLTQTQIPTPFSDGARMSLLAFALDRGGRGAYDRLISGRGKPMAVRLAAAAGLSPDSLITAWREQVLSARPNTVALTTRSAWTAVCWCFLLAVLALRSSRWR